MGNDELLESTIDETATTLRLTVRYREPDLNNAALRYVQAAIAGEVSPSDYDKVKTVQVMDSYRECKSFMELQVEGDFLYVVINTNNANRTADIENIFGYSSNFFLNDEFNLRMIDFLKTKFPNDFERHYAHVNLIEDHKNGQLDGYVLSGDFYAPDDRPDSFYPALLALTAYAFPALYRHYSQDIKGGQILGMFSDMKLDYMPFMSAPTETVLTDLAFRSRRKAFRRISINMTVSELALCHQIAKAVSADDLEYALRDLKFPKDRPQIEAWYRSIDQLEFFSTTVRRRLIRSIFDGGDLVDDAFDMVEKYATDYTFFKGVKSVDELHDRAMTLIPEITDDRYLSRIPENIAMNQTIEVEDTQMELILLVNQKDFVHTGKELRTCIGSASYFERSLRGESYCYQIFEDDKLIGALEIAERNHALKIIQCTGFRNAKLDFEDRIFGALRKSLNASELNRITL